MQHLGVTTFQAEDEIAAACAAIGASYAGTLGVTSSSGPGIALKGEAIGLCAFRRTANGYREFATAVGHRLACQPRLNNPIFIRLFTAEMLMHRWLFYQRGQRQIAFDVGIEAVRLATKYMTPVMLLTDGNISNAAEPWKIPDLDAYEAFSVDIPYGPRRFPIRLCVMKKHYLVFGLSQARLISCTGSAVLSGAMTRDIFLMMRDNHHKMTKIRAAKIDGVANDIPLQDIELGSVSGKLAIVGWGSTYGPNQPCC